MKDYYDEKYTNMGYNVLFIFGDKDLDTEYQYDTENKMAVLQCDDNFESLTTKTYMLFKMILTSSRLQDYDYIIKIDDDTEFNIPASQLIFQEDYLYFGPRLIKSEPKEHNYHFGKCSEDSELNLQPYDLTTYLEWGIGYFYVLHRKALQIFCDSIDENKDLLTNFLYEDMLVGKIMNDNNIQYFECFTRNVTTDLSRPRKTSITLVVNNKINFIPKSVSKIKKVSFNSDANINIIDNLEDKLNSELSINRELDKKIRELTEKINKHDNLNIHTKHDESPIINKVSKTFNPISHKHVTKIKGRVPMRR